MSLRIHVDAYCGHKANEGPRRFVLDEEVYEITAVLMLWHNRWATRGHCRFCKDIAASADDKEHSEFWGNGINVMKT